MPINNNFNGSLEALPMSPCTDGSLGFDAQFLGSSSLKLSESHSCDSLNEETNVDVHEASVASVDEVKRVGDETLVVAAEEEVEEEMEEEDEGEEKAHEEEIETVELPETNDGKCVLTATVEEARNEEHEVVLEHVHEQESSEVEMHAAEDDENGVEALTESTASMAVSCEDLIQSSDTTTNPEIAASSIPNRAVKSSIPTAAQSRGLSAASLELKKKQAAENAAAAIKAVAVEIPETDSIANRIKIFGGAATTRGIGFKKLGVRDMVQKFKNVEEQSQDQIAHVVRGHNDTEPHGVCSAYSLSTASRPLRTTPRRKMSHELSENETREVVSKFGGMAKNDDDRMGVSQESVHSVKNAKSIFENLARTESGAQR
ncbi:hypothetical protein BGX27_007613 [Mortierella sp. AM989]|nr:hypothetical protein BGX27_007613 [Mortierella sp. AM989]